MDYIEIFKALSNNSRLQMLEWLKEPEINFPEQIYSGFEHGVCVGQIQAKAGLTQSTVSEYLSILQRAGFIESKRVVSSDCQVKQTLKLWVIPTYYQWIRITH
jgi:DNA-binding transcriptional ArsR family regulator